MTPQATQMFSWILHLVSFCLFHCCNISIMPRSGPRPAAPQRHSKRRGKDKKDQEESDSDDELNVDFNPNYDLDRKKPAIFPISNGIIPKLVIDGFTPDAADENAVFCGAKRNNRG